MMYSRYVVKAATLMYGIFQVSPGTEPVSTKRNKRCYSQSVSAATERCILHWA